MTEPVAETAAGPAAAHCRYCASPLPANALLCKECGRWRSVLRNNLVFWSGFTGLVTLVASGSLFILTYLAAYQVRHYGADLQFRNISSLKEMSVLNNSSVAVVLGNIRFNFPGGQETSMIIDQAVPSGEILRVNLGELFAKQTIGGLKTYFSPPWVDKLVSAKDLGKDDAARAAAKKDILAKLDGSIYENHSVEAINDGGADSQMYRRVMSDLIQVPCTITVTYQVVEGDSFSKDIAGCIGLVRARLENPPSGKAVVTP